MADNNNLFPDADQPWLSQDAVAVPRLVHPLSKHHEKVLPIFNPYEKQSTKDHVKQFIMKVRLLNVRHEDVVCKLFPYTFPSKASTWYFSLP